MNCYIGFLGYKILCENINVHLPKQKSNNFYPGIFYRPQTIIKIRKNILIKSSLKNYRNFKIEKNKKYYHTDKFKVNINLQQYSKLFDKFSKKIKEGKTYQIKICQTYRNKAKINSIDFFWNLMKINQLKSD